MIDARHSGIKTGTVLLLMLVLVSAPIVLITVMLMQQRLTTLHGYEQSEQDIALFSSGLAVISAAADMRDLAPLTIHVDNEQIHQRFQYSRDKVAARLDSFLDRLRASEFSALHDQADQLENAWADLTIKTGIPVEDVAGPFENASRFFGRVYTTLGTLLYLSSMGGAEGLPPTEVLSLTVNSFRSVNEDIGLIRALATYAALRGGYLGDNDMRRLEYARQRLDAQLAQIDGEIRALALRSGSTTVQNQWLLAKRELDAYLLWVEDQLIVVPQITLGWEESLAQGQAPLAAVAALSNTLVSFADQIFFQQRQNQQQATVVLAVVLFILYLLVVTLTLLLFRSHLRALGARVESEAQSQFLARMSHEIRTPLNGVLGMTELLRETDPTARQREYIGLIESAGRTLSALVNDVLDYAQIESGQMKLEQAEFDPVALLVDCAYMFNLAASDNGTLVLVDSDCEVPSRVLGDATRLRQIVINLLSNAIKFTDNGRVLLGLSYQRSAEDGQGEFSFTVSDTGIGLSESEQKRLFQRFSQANSQTARRYGGSGLGLSISRELVAMMGGRISLDSAPGRGACFRFTLCLPVVSAAVPLMEGSSPSAIVWDAQGNLADWLVADPRFTGVRVVERLASLSAALTKQPGGPLLINGLPEKNVLEEVLSLCRLQSEPVVTLMLTGMRVRVPELDSRLRLIRRSVLTVTELQQLLSEQQDQAGLRPLQHEAAAVRSNQRPLRVLVAEDNPVNQMVTRGYLSRLGITDLQIAEDGQQALEYYRAAPEGFELVLMDLDMPVMDGFASARAIRAYERPLRRAPAVILALSAHAMPQHEVMISDAGMDGHLIKPLSLRAMEKALEAYMGFMR